MHATISFYDGSWAVQLAGEIDIASREELSGIGEAAALLPPRCIEVDLSAVTFIDAGGLGALIDMRRAVTCAGSRMIIRHPSAAAARLFTLTGTTAALIDPPPDGAPKLEVTNGRAVRMRGKR